MAKAPRSADLGWRYGEMVRGRKDRVRCNYCHRVVPGGITHFKRHFIGNRKGTGACISAPEEVREIIRRHFNEPQETRVNCVGAGEHQDSTVAIHAESGLLEAVKSPVSPKFPMAKAPCSVDIGWRYGEMVRGRKDRVKCNYCHRVVPGGITHFKRHFIGNRKGIGACISASEEVREIIRRHFNEPQETRVNCVGAGEHQGLSSGLPPLAGCLPLYATISCHQGPQDSTVAIHAESGLLEAMKSPVAKTPKFSMAKAPCSADIGWRYGEMVRGRKDRVRCNYCHRVVPGGITHFKRHFIGNRKGTGACISAPEEVREIIRRHFNEPQETRVNCFGAGEHQVGNRRTKIMTRRAMMELRTSETAHTECVFDSHPCHPSKEVSVRKRKHIGSKEQRKLTSEKDTIQSFYSSLPLYTQAKRLRGIKERIRSSKEQKKLDTNVFESYLEYLWSSIPDKKRESYTYLDCLWFSLYKKGPSQSKVLTWIKKKQIFSRQYVFVPIICWRHWSLLILCHFGESFLSKDKQPCMLLLDSLGKIDPMRLEPDIRRFVLDIYKTKGCEEDSISKIPLLVPKVPQQRNGEECGIFVLYFIHLFLQSAPKAFSQEGYPYFLTESWFTWEDMEKFRKGVLDFASDKYSTKCNDGSSH